MTEPFTHGRRLTVERVTGHLGADIHGVDLAGPLSPETVAGIRAALLTHKVIFFRGQKLDHTSHVTLARRFGEITRRAGARHGSHPDGFPEILTVDPEAEDARYGRDFEERYRRKWLRHDSGWHTDLASAVNPPAISILRSEVTPVYGGDTHWTNLAAAYRGLSEPLRKLVDGLRAEHTFFAGTQMLRSSTDDMKTLADHAPDALIAIHPVVRVHPETGERALFVQPASVVRVLDLLPPESGHLLDLLFEQITRPEYTVRFRWEPGCVVFWDNRATAHLPPVDLGHTEQHRTLFRISLLGDRPVGPDGFTSEAVVGSPLVAFPPGD